MAVAPSFSRQTSADTYGLKKTVITAVRLGSARAAGAVTASTCAGRTSVFAQPQPFYWSPAPIQSSVCLGRDCGPVLAT